MVECSFRIDFGHIYVDSGKYAVKSSNCYASIAQLNVIIAHYCAIGAEFGLRNNAQLRNSACCALLRNEKNTRESLLNAHTFF